VEPCRRIARREERRDPGLVGCGGQVALIRLLDVAAIGRDYADVEARAARRPGCDDRVGDGHRRAAVEVEHGKSATGEGRVVLDRHVQQVEHRRAAVEGAVHDATAEARLLAGAARGVARDGRVGDRCRRVDQVQGGAAPSLEPVAAGRVADEAAVGDGQAQDVVALTEVDPIADRAAVHAGVAHERDAIDRQVDGGVRRAAEDAVLDGATQAECVIGTGSRIRAELSADDVNGPRLTGSGRIVERAAAAAAGR
jgi:hypothetical protein